jgi:hypothetical protein
MQQQIIEQIFRRLGITCALKLTQTLTSAVTTAWGVDWDEIYIARDIMQNFFDANRDRVEEIIVETNNTDVLIKAPAAFNLERLFYLGSEKGDSDVGHYGEGFKVAATCLLRDHKVTPIAVSGCDVAVLRVADHKIANTQMNPIEYDFYRSDQEMPGTLLILTNCSKNLIKAMSEGLTHFFHDKNPLLGDRVWSNGGDEFSLYESRNGKGHAFYRKLKRGEIAGIPVVLVINKEYSRIEKKISKDRDRNAFGDEVMKLFYNIFARLGLKYAREPQRAILRAAQSCWEKGHPLLSEIADSISLGWTPEEATAVFGSKYYARSSGRFSDNAMQAEINRLENSWREQSKVCLPNYFQKFGVLNAVDVINRAQQKATEESKKNNQRRPTTAEHAAITLLSGVLQELAPEIVAVFSRVATIYTVAKTEVVLGQLKSGRGYRSREVFFSEDVFVSDFAAALAIFLHEHAHIFGYDGSRGFTDALTHLLEMVVKQRNTLNDSRRYD